MMNDKFFFGNNEYTIYDDVEDDSEKRTNLSLKVLYQIGTKPPFVCSFLMMITATTKFSPYPQALWG